MSFCVFVVSKKQIEIEKIKFTICAIIIGIAVLISATLLAPSTSAQMPVQKDTFEKAVSTEYVTNPVDTLGEDVYVWNETEIVGNKEKGEKFNKWFWQMVGCADDDGNFDAKKLNGASIYFEFPDKDYKQLAADIMSTFDENGDNKVNYYEYATKSVNLVNAQARQILPQSVMNEFKRDLFIPLFNGFDYDDNKNEYDVNELAATLYALDCYSSSSSGGKGYICGHNLLRELNYVIDNGRPDISFRKSRIEYYENNVRR